MMNEFRPLFSNLISENPVNPFQKQPGQHTRNLKYISSKALLADNYPYHNSLFPEAVEEIKNTLHEKEPETQALGIRLARTLPLLFRIKLVEICENELLGLAQKEGGYSFEVAADLSELLLSVFELTCQSEDIYFDVNQRIITIFSRYLDSSLSGDKNSFRNGCEVLRNIFTSFGYTTQRQELPENKLVNKLINLFLPVSALSQMDSPEQPGKNNSRFIALVLRCRELECRLRVRQLFGFCCLVSYLPQSDGELLDLLSREVLEVAENVSECDVVLECFGCLTALAAQEQPYYMRNQLLKRWLGVTEQMAFKKEYLEFYVFLLNLCSSEEAEVPHKLAYALAIHCLELTRHLQQQFSRFLVYARSCQIILRVSRRSSRSDPDCNLLLRIFQYDWFIDRINQEGDLFKSEFLIALLHHAILLPGRPSCQHLLDLLDIAHRLIDWRCWSKEETHVPTLKFAFDMYLVVLKWACEILSEQGGEGV